MSREVLRGSRNVYEEVVGLQHLVMKDVNQAAALVSPVSSVDGGSCSSEVEKPGLELLCQVASLGRGKNEEVSEENAQRIEDDAGVDEQDMKVKRKKPWTVEEDELLRGLVDQYGANRWTFIAMKISGRTGKQARERWLNQLDPELKRKGWTAEEDKIIIETHAQYGNKWSLIASFLEGRTDNAIKNRFNSTLRRRLQRQSTNMHFARANPYACYQMPPVDFRQPVQLVPRHAPPVYVPQMQYYPMPEPAMPYWHPHMRAHPNPHSHSYHVPYPQN